ncbi:hypothetical protein THASP1DRAFT_25893 [Thamnocephalis sphaerospora]|uniref:Uncharacterized protein n=1 Tax=Thamnocephalis sphaerospora TaxID=78915 RepID=A0A4P9XK79_9FUNG|nr:hypothetical protein THASP1DRAFT_25893 [Thamnocephalis sphaerospora]|eukprot:RKP05640.1 hypothetical protein THASP1DRAFT_25893 [Thamnocephalis sphaerospora]
MSRKFFMRRATAVSATAPAKAGDANGKDTISNSLPRSGQFSDASTGVAPAAEGATTPGQTLPTPALSLSLTPSLLSTLPAEFAPSTTEPKKRRRTPSLLHAQTIAALGSCVVEATRKPAQGRRRNRALRKKASSKGTKAAFNKDGTVFTCELESAFDQIWQDFCIKGGSGTDTSSLNFDYSGHSRNRSEDSRMSAPANVTIVDTSATMLGDVDEGGMLYYGETSHSQEEPSILDEDSSSTRPTSTDNATQRFSLFRSLSQSTSRSSARRGSVLLQRISRRYSTSNDNAEAVAPAIDFTLQLRERATATAETAKGTEAAQGLTERSASLRSGRQTPPQSVAKSRLRLRSLATNDTTEEEGRAAWGLAPVSPDELTASIAPSQSSQKSESPVDTRRDGAAPRSFLTWKRAAPLRVLTQRFAGIGKRFGTAR